MIGLTLHLCFGHSANEFVPPIDFQISSLEILDENEGTGVVDDGAELRFLRPQSIFCLLARSDVFGVCHCVDRFAVFIAQDPPLDERPDNLAVLAYVSLLNAVLRLPSSK